jgi:hypothetical protein
MPCWSGAFYLAAWIRFFGNEQLLSGSPLAMSCNVRWCLLPCSSLSMTAFGMYVMHSREGLNGHAVRAIAATIAGGCGVDRGAVHHAAQHDLAEVCLPWLWVSDLVIILTSRAILLRGAARGVVATQSAGARHR